MAKTFSDNLSRDWTLHITVAAMRRAKAKDVDLSMPVSQLQQFVMDDRDEQLLKGAADQAVIPPDHLGLARFEAGQLQPAQRAGADLVDCHGRKARDRQVVHHGLEAFRTRRA